MKKIIIAITLFARSSSVAAQGICPYIGLLAQEIMTSRQAGVPLDSMIRVFDRGDKSLFDISKKIALLAYDYPAYQTNSVKISTVNEFRNQMVLMCYKDGAK